MFSHARETRYAGVDDTLVNLHNDDDHVSDDNMASGFPVVALLVIVLGLMAVSWLATPKGPQQTYVTRLVCLHRPNKL